MLVADGVYCGLPEEKLADVEALVVEGVYAEAIVPVLVGVRMPAFDEASVELSL